MVFSSVAVLYQMCRSIPSFLPAQKILSLGLKACIGTIQGLVGSFIVPFLASKMIGNKHVFTTVSNLIMTCFVPLVVIMYLDTGCLGRWVELWKPCRTNQQLFQLSLICTQEDEQDCVNIYWEVNIPVVRASDICDPHPSWSLASIATCIHISLLRLQEILLAKFVTTGHEQKDSLPYWCSVIIPAETNRYMCERIVIDCHCASGGGTQGADYCGSLDPFVHAAK